MLAAVAGDCRAAQIMEGEIDDTSQPRFAVEAGVRGSELAALPPRSGHCLALTPISAAIARPDFVLVHENVTYLLPIDGIRGGGWHERRRLSRRSEA
jgi:hypothetical protein